MRNALLGLLYLPGMVAVIVLSLALAIVGLGLIEALFLVLRFVPSRARQIEALTVPIIIGGVIILGIATIAFIVKAIIGAGRAIPSQESEIFPRSVPIPMDDPHTTPPALPPGRIVDEAPGGRTPSRARSSTFATRQTRPFVMWSTTLLSGLAAGIVYGGILAATRSMIGWEQATAGLIIGLVAATGAFLFQHLVLRPRAQR